MGKTLPHPRGEPKVLKPPLGTFPLGLIRRHKEVDCADEGLARDRNFFCPPTPGGLNQRIGPKSPSREFETCSQELPMGRQRLSSGKIFPEPSPKHLPMAQNEPRNQKLRVGKKRVYPQTSLGFDFFGEERQNEKGVRGLRAPNEAHQKDPFPIVTASTFKMPSDSQN